MISFNAGTTGFELKNKRLFTAWIKNAIAECNKKAGDIAFVFMSDDELLEMNRKYLKHNTLTDIITFNYNENEVISGDICISIERVKENAASFNVDVITELKRVMIHGVLHLLGYNDKSDKESAQMRSQEDFYLTKLNF